MPEPKENLACLVRNGGHKPCRFLSYRCFHGPKPGEGLPYNHCRTCGEPLKLEFTYKWEIGSEKEANRDRLKDRMSKMYE